MYIWEAKTQNMKKQLLSVLFLFFSLSTITYATELNPVHSKISGSKSVVIPANDECSNATNITVNSGMEIISFVSGSTLDATPTIDQLPYMCNDYQEYANDVWFSFTATAKKHFINFTDVMGEDYDLTYVVYSGNCFNLLPFECNYTSNNPTTVLKNLVIGANYKIRVNSSIAGSTNNMTFNVSITTPLPVPNDECSGAIEMTVNSTLEPESFVTGDLLSATGSITPEGCYTDVTLDDMWYKFVATSEQHFLKIFNTNPEDSFTYALFGGCGTSGEQLICGWEMLSMLDNLVVGNTYRLKIINNNQYQTNPINFSLAILTAPAVPNDDCSSSINIPVNALAQVDLFVQGNSFGATTSPGPSPCPSNSPDVWFHFIATSQTHIVKFFDLEEGSLYFTHAVMSGNDCINLSEIDCYAYDDTIIYNNLVVGTTYKIRVHNTLQNTVLSGNFKVSVLTPALPANDECFSATSIPINPNLSSDLFVSGTTYAASASTQPNTCAGNDDDDVWFSFTPTSSVHILNFLNMGGNTSDLRYTIYSGNDCSGLTQIQCSTLQMQVLNNLVVGNPYKIRVYTSPNDAERVLYFSIALSTPTPTTNDLCSQAIPIMVNSNVGCAANYFGTITGATPSTDVANSCPGTEDDDIWFVFTATSSNLLIELSNIYGTSMDVNYSVYSGTCGNMVQLYCSNSNITSNSDYIVGQVYYLRVWSSAPTYQAISFDVCIRTISICENAEPFCGSTVDDPYIFQNSTGMPSTMAIACLDTTPNPTFYTLHVSQSGTLVYEITQNTNFNNNGVPLGSNLDVDFVAWGPFDAPESCDLIQMVGCPSCPNNTGSPPNFYPFENIVDCSYDGSFLETLTIPNAVAGQFYTVLITNFNGQDGFIKLSQINSNDPDAGKTACADKFQLVAFVDANNNAIKEPNEANFTYGSFSIQKNNTGAVNNVSNSVGKYSIYETNTTNTYDFNYQIHSEYAPYYSLSPTSFNDLSITLGAGTQFVYFPINLTQAYNDVNVSITSLNEPRPGFANIHKIVYKNTGILPVSGVISYMKDPSVSIDNASPAVTNTPSGFTYNYSNLLPTETRSITVNLDVPSIPVVNLDDIVTASATISVTDAPDINMLNNTFTVSSTVVGSYDPNDKNEARGKNIDISQFNQDDYLFYTIRFQNTGSASAIDVKIIDVLESSLDPSSIRMVSSSHNYVMERTNNNVTWIFNNIQLPGILQNEALSNGYVTFKIKPNAGFAVGDVIENTAAIYFDTNPPIITNTFETEFVQALGNQQFSAGNLIIYPNPSNGLVYINTQNTTENLKEINLYDVLGKTILSSKNLSSRQSTIDVSSLAKGIYMIEITTENNYKQTKKLVVK